MKLKSGHLLTYCTNIHPGETWAETFGQLQQYLPAIKAQVSPNAPFGVGLRLSDQASREILLENRLEKFKQWLNEQGLFVYTINGFPYGGFHKQVVKDLVHKPDWTHTNRIDYTERLFDILSTLLPKEQSGSISTSPLSYKHWYTNNEPKLQATLRLSALHLAVVVEQIYQIQRNKQIMLHLDLEPEPDGLLENTQEVIDFFTRFLLPLGTKHLVRSLNLSESEAKKALLDHIRVCYDVCHFAVGYEKPPEVFEKLAKAGIQVGKIQISAALKVAIPQDPNQKTGLQEELTPFAESTYLHQVIEKDAKGQLTNYPDLSEALKFFPQLLGKEWRIHYHVPIFLPSYGRLDSTQSDILEVLAYIRQHPVCEHLEVETYTWDVLPQPIRTDLKESIVRELMWVQSHLEEA
jgi:hypothetical protein